MISSRNPTDSVLPEAGETATAADTLLDSDTCLCLDAQMCSRPMLPFIEAIAVLRGANVKIGVKKKCRVVPKER